MEIAITLERRIVALQIALECLEGTASHPTNSRPHNESVRIGVRITPSQWNIVRAQEAVPYEKYSVLMKEGRTSMKKEVNHVDRIIKKYIDLLRLSDKQ
jgi:hypothetical protein